MQFWLIDEHELFFISIKSIRFFFVMNIIFVSQFPKLCNHTSIKKSKKSKIHFVNQKLWIDYLGSVLDAPKQFRRNFVIWEFTRYCVILNGFSSPMIQFKNGTIILWYLDLKMHINLFQKFALDVLEIFWKPRALKLKRISTWFFCRSGMVMFFAKRSGFVDCIYM